MVKVQSIRSNAVIEVADEHWSAVLQPQGQYVLYKETEEKEDVIPSEDGKDATVVVVKKGPGRPKKIINTGAQ